MQLLLLPSLCCARWSWAAKHQVLLQWEISIHITLLVVKVSIAGALLELFHLSCLRRKIV